MKENLSKLNQLCDWLQKIIQLEVDEQSDNCKVVILQWDRIFVNGGKMSRDEWREFGHSVVERLHKSLNASDLFYVYSTSDWGFSLSTEDTVTIDMINLPIV